MATPIAMIEMRSIAKIAFDKGSHASFSFMKMARCPWMLMLSSTTAVRDKEPLKVPDAIRCCLQLAGWGLPHQLSFQITLCSLCECDASHLYLFFFQVCVVRGMPRHVPANNCLHLPAVQSGEGSVCITVLTLQILLFGSHVIVIYLLPPAHHRRACCRLHYSDICNPCLLDH